MVRLLVIVALMVASPVQAARIGFFPELTGLRSGTCPPIVIAGTIEDGDEDVFQRVVLQGYEAGCVPDVVQIYSNGGSLLAAMGIGIQVSTLMLRTQAPLTIGSARLCPFGGGESGGWTYDGSKRTGDARCTCASACFFVWSAGAVRDGGYIALHRPALPKGKDAVPPQDVRAAYKAIDDTVRTYLSGEGIAASVINRLLRTSSETVLELSKAEIERIGHKAFYEEALVAKCGASIAAANRRAEAQIRIREGSTASDMQRMMADFRKVLEDHERCHRGLRWQMLQGAKAAYMAQFVNR